MCVNTYGLSVLNIGEERSVSRAHSHTRTTGVGDARDLSKQAASRFGRLYDAMLHGAHTGLVRSASKIAHRTSHTPLTPSARTHIRTQAQLAT